MKNILIVGANGRVGSLVAIHLDKKKYKVFAGARQEKKELTNQGVHFRKIDLAANTSNLASAIGKDIDVLIFTAGSRGKELLKIDLHGAINTMKAAEKIGVKRFIMLSAVYSLHPEKWDSLKLPSSMVDYYLAKHYADRWLIDQTKLEYTILQPGALYDGESNQKIEVSFDTPGKNSLLLVAQTIISILEEQSTINKIIPMKEGNKNISKAFQELK